MYSTPSRATLTRRGVLAMAVLPFLAGATQNIRIVSYNTQDDVGHSESLTIPNLATVLEGIGQQKYVGDSTLQLPDIITLQETTSNAVTVAPLATSLNTYYGNSNYNYSATQTVTTGTGNGPSALIYNQSTVRLLESFKVGTVGGSANGEYRQVMRYEMQPVLDSGTTGAFYIYVVHSKSLSSGVAATNKEYQREEASYIRTDELTLPATAAVLYMGDWNADAASDPSMSTMTAAGQGQAFDPINPSNTWASNSANVTLLTDSVSSLHYRDDIQYMTGNVYNGTTGVLNYISGSAHPFGNNGSTAYGGNTNLSTNTSINDIANYTGHGSLTVSQVLAAMNSTTGSDHLPVVADYSIAILANGIWAGGVGNWSTAAMWSNSTVPNSSSVEVKIDNANAAASVVTMDTIATIADITIDANDTLNITATHSLTISGAPVNLFNGTFTNAGTLAATAINNTGTFSTTGTFTGSGNFNNSGTATLGGSQTWTSGVTLLNLAGTTTFTSDAGSGATTPVTLNLNVNVSAGSVVFSSNQHLKSLTLANGSSAVATLQSNHSSHTLLTLGTLSFFSTNNTWQGKLDLNGNDLDVQTGVLANLIAQAKLGFNDGAWNGSNGIISSAATADTSHLTALGVIQNNQSGTALFTGNNKFDGAIPGVGDILVKYTYYGDANLSGKVDSSDYSLIDSGYLTHATGWFNGDFNYDGTINGSDYTLTDNAFNRQGAVLTSTIADPIAGVTTEIAGVQSAVPEPTTMSLLGIASVGVLCRRRRSAGSTR